MRGQYTGHSEILKSWITRESYTDVFIRFQSAPVYCPEFILVAKNLASVCGATDLLCIRQRRMGKQRNRPIIIKCKHFAAPGD